LSRGCNVPGTSIRPHFGEFRGILDAILNTDGTLATA
jgi:hypothetical protein